MWWLRAFESNFELPVVEGRVQVFRLLVGLACTLKFVQAVRYGGWDRFLPGTFERFRIESTLPRSASVVLAAYRPLLGLRLGAAVLLTVGVAARVALVVIVIALGLELLYEFRSHTTFLLACCVCLLVAGSLGSGLTFSPARTSVNAWSQCLIVLLVTDLYWVSAIAKLRSEQFRSGAALTQYVYFMNAVRDRLTYPDLRYPATAVRLLGRNDQDSVRRWRMLSGLTIVVEILLPFGLLTPATYPYAAVVGIGMHAVFTFLLPRRLAPFSIATAGSYVLFQP